MITLLSAEPEIQLIALKNINLMIQKRPNIFQKELKKFYVDFNDPIYIKMEKLDIIYRLADEKNMDYILLELKKYTNEVDVEFVRKSLRVIGQLAIKLEKAANICVGTLKECIKTRKPYVV